MLVAYFEPIPCFSFPLAAALLVLSRPAAIDFDFVFFSMLGKCTFAHLCMQLYAPVNMRIWISARVWISMCCGAKHPVIIRGV